MIVLTIVACLSFGLCAEFELGEFPNVGTCSRQAMPIIAGWQASHENWTFIGFITCGPRQVPI